MTSDQQTRLAAYDDRELDPRERLALDRLLDESPEARAYLAALRADRQRFREAFGAVSARPGFAAGVMGRLPRPRVLHPMPRLMELAAAGLMAFVAFSVAGPTPGLDTARRNVCQENAKSLAQAILSYSNDYDGRFPDAANWAAQVASYAPRQQAFVCPEDAAPAATSYGMPLGLSYAPVESLPGRDILLYDATGPFIDPRHERRSAAVAAFADGSVDVLRVDGR